MRTLTRRAAVLAGVLALATTGCAAAERKPAGGLEELRVVTRSGAAHVFQVEIAATPEQRDRGLMFRDSLPRDHGMLFQFPDAAERSFWMRNTYIPLDILFLGRDGRVISIARNTTPRSDAPILSYGAAKGVLEINGGLSRELGIEPGDRVVHPFFGGR